MAKIEVKQVSLTRGSIAENMTMFNPALNDQDLLRQTTDQVNLTDKTIMFVAHNLSAEIRQLFDREIHLD